MENKYMYVLTGLVFLSLAINGAFIYGFFTAKGEAVDSLKDAENELDDLKTKKLSFTHKVDQTVIVPLDTTVDVPIEENVHTTVTISGEEKEIVIPIDKTTTVQIQDNVEVPLELEIDIEKTLEEIGLGSAIEDLQEKVRNMRKKIQNIP